VLVKDYSHLPDAADFSDHNKRFSLTHIDIDRLVILLLEGQDLASDMHAHLLKCTRCRHSMVAAVLAELPRWRHTTVCKTRDSLFIEWRDAVETYTKALAELTSKAGRVPDPELLSVAKITEIGRKLTASIRAEFDEHIAEHCC
jgi:hypothetical protein